MNPFLIFLISFLSSGEQLEVNSKAHLQEKFTTYYFIRHAEKDESDPKNKDPELSAAGLERTKKWIEVFKEVQFDLIFSTNYSRTRTTASAIADSQKKKVEIYDPKMLFEPGFQKQTKGKTILVVGHSNTNPAFVNMILEEKKYRDIDEKESGSLYIVTIGPNGKKTSQVLYIN